MVTKIWHTHLGYERTKHAVKETLQNLGPVIKDSNVDLKLHILIHWPQCFDGVDGMDCELEENNLPLKVKKAGPAPNLDKRNAWKQSWKALEDIYKSADNPNVASIGVSNFSAEDLELLIEISDIKPHIVQMNISSLLEANFFNLCKRNRIHIQLTNIMSGIVLKAPETPRAYNSLLMIGNALSKESDKGSRATPPQTVLKWAIQNGISTISRTTDLDHLTENSAMEIKKLPEISDHKNEILTKAIEAIHSGIDLDEDLFIKVTFHAAKQDVFVYEENAKKQKHVAYISKGDSFDILAHPNNIYRVYDAYNKELHREYNVGNCGYGDHVHIQVVDL